ncbi:type II toxin-antitoxin system HicB family antitoxin [Lentilactobacillus sp. IMAU92037]|uniref:type II toxin-antitoxin system HicB family antitoxin n=1 Tax=Lentilactobacillus TaxID=2767893 RepID=UPI001C264301|nr:MULTISPECIES: type II toxin-antitoxin system HicB family antitoxin [Lentilactobacillus]MBU9788157.1 type II toxin-antitoxin system HicB family antitoxin [Lentilactobacillus dabitei]MBV0929529.1 type II toxin-antitoxin system HicB family antitoxin [Lentilactobacillus dabitei]MDM7515134.1 type II toxin-antitoxin system HicB family antitoxin [Lentilactobacillus sp. TOM.63]
MKSDIVIYPVVLVEDASHYFVEAPDFPNGFTQGDNMIDAIKMAMDLIGNLLQDKINYPKPSEIRTIRLKANEQVVYVSVDLTEFRMQHPEVTKITVKIPAYLDQLAREHELNLSQVTTSVLKAKFGC